ncbi:hypothetical protein M2272_005901 [Mycobacterium frederiksbergense]|uniref:YqaJ viral recombinase domain-containing protein n=1 Tax=Mycolicibacterium frederiksbergense TaxID=117567 RepID=A0ABT6L8M2_9MYCO|nr:lambda exonuclease family protein [Mycolicibacterium frederiksbergense]MDH6199233.1 hypothetical protein [Mycolicibacterium frederiksbergense]
MSECAACGKSRTNSSSDPHGQFGHHEFQPKADPPMTIHTFSHVEQRSEEWYKQRRGMVTASAVGKLITPKTVKPAANPDSRGLTMLLAAERITGYTDPTFISDDMWRGIEDEPIARDWYSENHAPVTETGFIVRELDGFKIGYSPDGLVGEVGLIEVKSRRQKTQLSTFLDDQPPIEVMAQLQCGLLVSGREWIDYVSWCGGMVPFVKRVLPSQKWFDAITEAVAAFEENVGVMVRTYERKTEGKQPVERVQEVLI